jgi:hypothetical protein
MTTISNIPVPPSGTPASPSPATPADLRATGPTLSGSVASQDGNDPAIAAITASGPDQQYTSGPAPQPVVSYL